MLRSLVTEMLLGDGEITIRGSAPMTEGNGCSANKLSPHPARRTPRFQDHLLLRGSAHPALRGSPVRVSLGAGLQRCGVRSLADHASDHSVAHPVALEIGEVSPDNVIEVAQEPMIDGHL